MLILNVGEGREGGGGGTALDNGVVVKGLRNLKTHCCIPYLNLTPKFNYITLLRCQIRAILIIYRPTISSHEIINLTRVGTPQ